MHTEPVRQENPASSALFLRLAAVETPPSTLIVGVKCFESMAQRRIEGHRRHAKRHAPAPPTATRGVIQSGSRLFARRWPPRVGKRD